MNQPSASLDNMANKLHWSLFGLRITVFLVMFVWVLDKFVNPEHSAKIFEKFYGIAGLGEVTVYVMGALQLALVLAFVAGFKKRISYALILVLHAGSTLSSLPHYFDPFNNLLFFAAWPMLAACITLYLLRDADTKLTV